MTTETIQPLTDEEKAQLADLSQRAAAAEAAEKAAADDSLRALVASQAYKDARAAMATALPSKPLEVDLSYAIGCMDRLTERYRT